MMRFALAGLCALWAGLTASAADIDPGRAGALLSHPAAARGDADAKVRAWIEQAKTHPDSPLAEVALRLAATTPPEALRTPSAGTKELRSFLAGNRGDPVATDVARAALAARLAMRGEQEQADGLLHARALARHWFVIGPFGRYAHANFYTRFGPDDDPDLTARHAGTTGEVAWRPIGPDACLPALDPWDHVHPRAGVVFLLAQFRLQEDREVVFHVRTGCAYALRVDGRAHAQNDRLAQSLPLERFWGPCRLSAGWHRLLIKAYPAGADRMFSLRLLDADSRPLEHATWEPDRTLHPVGAGAPTTGASSLSARPTPALAALRQAYQRAPSEAGLHAALGALCAEQDRPEEALRHSRRAAALAPDTAAFHVLHARAIQSARHLAEGQRENQSHEAYARAAALEPGYVPALLGLASYEQDRKRFHEALACCRRALKANDRSLPALAFRARLAIRQNWITEARTWTEALRRAHPEALETWALDAMLAAQLDDHARLEAAYRRVAEARLDRPAFRLRRARALARIGQLPQARSLLDALPPRVDLFADAAELYAQMGALEQAEACLRQAIDILPDRAQTWRDLGDVLFLASDPDAARETYRASLAREPGQHDLRRLVATLEGASADFWQPYAQDARLALAAARSAGGNGGTVRLIDQAVIQVYADGSYACLTHELQKILHRSGIKDAGTVELYGHLIEARTMLPDGRVLEPVRLPGRNSLTMPNLAPGAAVDYKYLAESQGHYDQIFRFPKWYFRSPNTEEAFRFSELIVRTPTTYPLVFAERNFEGYDIRFSQTTDGDQTVYKWTGRDMPRAVHEPGCPHIDEMLPFVEVGGRRSWQDINHLLMNAYLSRLRLTPSLRDEVARLTETSDTSRDKVARLHAFVCTEIEARTGPHQASQILHQRTGDRNILLMALLRAAGLEPLYAAVRPSPRLLYEPAWEMPQSRHFPLRLVTVCPDGKDDRLWLDTRYRTLGCGELVEDVAGATAFLVGQHAGTFRTIPPRPPEAFATVEERRIHVPPGTGPLRIHGTRLVRGRAAHEKKTACMHATQRELRNRLEDHLTRSLPGVVTVQLDLPDLQASGTPFRQTYEAEVPLMLRKRQHGGCAVPLCLTPLQLLPAGEDDPDNRETPYHLKEVQAGTDRVLFVLPPESRIRRLPRPLLVQRTFGSYHLQARSTPDGVLVERHYAFEPQRISLTDWPSFLETVRRIEAAEEQLLEWAAPPADAPGNTAAHAGQEPE